MLFNPLSMPVFENLAGISCNKLEGCTTFFACHKHLCQCHSRLLRIMLIHLPKINFVVTNIQNLVFVFLSNQIITQDMTYLPMLYDLQILSLYYISKKHICCSQLISKQILPKGLYDRLSLDHAPTQVIPT